MSSEIELTVDGGPMPLYVAEPKAAPRAGVIVIQEIFGITQPMKNVADLLAGEGYLAVVPAMFHRTDPHFLEEYNDAGIKAGMAAAMQTTPEGIEADLAASAAYLREKLGAHAKVGVWGFCFGGSLAYRAATYPFVDVAVSFYGGQIARSHNPERPAIVEKTPEIHAPLFLAFGGLDGGITSDDIQRIRTALKDAHKDFELHVYEESGHGFFRPGPESSADAAQAWKQVREYLAARTG